MTMLGISTHYLPKPFLQLENPKSNSNDCYVFERCAFWTIGLFIAVFCRPDCPRQKPLIGAMDRWLGTLRFELTALTELESGPRYLHPFELKSDELSAPFVEELKKLKVNTGMFVHCGGNVPIDLILIVRTSATTFAARYCDGKHKAPTSKDGQCVTAAVLTKLVAKSEAIHLKLTRKFRTVHKDWTLEAFDATHVTAITKDEESDNRTINPATFTWHPWSHILFALPTGGTDLKRRTQQGPAKEAIE
jgi:hypothetical protein